MSAADQGWVALEAASSAFERPSWAVRALIDQGKLERKVERGQVYVRFPRADEPSPTPEPEAAPSAPEVSLDALATELTETLELALAVAPPAPTNLAVATPAHVTVASPASTNTPIATPMDAALWSEVAANLAELAHAARARDALLARTAQALRAVEAATARAAVAPSGREGREPVAITAPARARFPWALASILAALAGASCAFAHLEKSDASGARHEAELALRRATRLEARARHQQAEVTALALTLATTRVGVAPIGSGRSVPAGFAK